MAAVIATARLDLMPLRQAHADELFSLLSDSSLYEFTSETPPASVVELRARYAKLETRCAPDGSSLWLNWVLRERATGMAVGYVQATVGSECAEIAWVVGTPWQRRGLAKEAAMALGLWLPATGVKVLRACIHPRHMASQGVARHIGLAPTGRMHDGEEIWERLLIG